MEARGLAPLAALAAAVAMLAGGAYGASTKTGFERTHVKTAKPKTSRSVAGRSTLGHPVSLRATPLEESVIMLAWRGARGATGYRLFHGTLPVATITKTEYFFTELACSTAHSLGVEAFDSSGATSKRVYTSATTLACTDTEPPTAPDGFVQFGHTETSITMGWAASTDNVGIAGYDLFRDGLPAGATTQTSHIFAELACGQTYTLSAEAVDASGNRSGRTSVLMTTAACPDVTPPTAPTQLQQTAASQTSVSLAWSSSSDDVAVTGYGVYLNGNRAGATTSTSYTVGGLSCGSGYTVAVDASDAVGNRSTAASVVVATAPCAPSATSADTQPPSVPQNQRIAETTATTITMTWDASTDDVAVTGYNVYLDNALVGTTTELSYTYAGLTCATTYTVALEARDAAGNVSDRRYATGPATTSACAGDTSPPTSPPNLTVASATSTSISLSWGASSDDVGVTGYGVYRNGSRVAELAASAGSYELSGLDCGTSHTLAVDAVDAAGNRSTAASVVAATGPCADATPPTAPSGVRVTATSETSVALAWDPSSDNVGVTGYGAYLAGVRVGTTASPSYALGGLVCGTTYAFSVDAYDAAGNRSGQTALMVSTSACPADTQAPSAPSGLAASGITDTSITLTWNASTDNIGVTGYTAYRDGAAAGTTASSTRSFAFGSLTCGTSYTLGVEAFDATGNTSQRSSLTASTSACPSATGTGANLWVSPGGGSCARSATPAAFDAARSCASFAAAYAAAVSGDVVGVTGSLPSQYFAGGYGSSQPAGTKTITFRGEPGNTIKQVHSGSPNITYDGLTLDAGGVKTFGAVFENGGGSNVTFRNGRIGNVVDEKAALVSGSNFTFDNVVFHDAVLRTDGVHMECVYAIVVPGFTIRNSSFTNCAVMDLYFTYGTWWNPLPPPYGDITVEGNRFGAPRFANGACCMYYTLVAGNTASPSPGSIDGWTVRNNWFESSVTGFDGGRTITNSIFCGNTGAAPTSWRASC